MHAEWYRNVQAEFSLAWDNLHTQSNYVLFLFALHKCWAVSFCIQQQVLALHKCWAVSWIAKKGTLQGYFSVVY